MPITPLPTPPSRSDTANFSTRSDAFLAALPTFVTEANALQVATNAQTAADAAVAYANATAAAAARDLAIAAWSASMSPAETLPAIAKSLHSGAVVEVLLYDTSKDVDGGAWRKRCADKAWYTETLGGVGWLGQAATAAAAWALGGAVTGSYFQNTTDGKFYQLGASSPTVAEVFRGNAREFPAQVAVVAEAARVVIYDLTQVGTPMWMVFVTTAGYALHSGTVNAVAMLGAKLVVGMSTQAIEIDFVANNVRSRNATSYSANTLDVSGRNTAGAWAQINATALLVNATVNDVALTVLSTSALDAATGLQIPTIAVATAGGMSTVTAAGTVTNSTSIVSVLRLAFYGKKLTSVRSDGVVSAWNDVTIIGVAPDTTYTASSVPATLGAASITSPRKHLGSTLGMSIVAENTATPAAGMVAQITNLYNTGWMPGDIQAAFCANVAASITDRSVKARASTSTTIVTAAVATGTDLRSFTATVGNITATLGATVANGCHIHWELVSGVWKQYICSVSGAGASTATGYINGVASAAVPITNVAVAAGTGVTILNNVTVANARFSATLVTAAQAAQMYTDELPMFSANMQSTIAGSSTAVTALAFDDVADAAQVGTSWGRTSFRGLTRIDSEATTTGALTSVAGAHGAVVTGGAASARFAQPAYTLRDALLRGPTAPATLSAATSTTITISNKSGAYTIVGSDNGTVINCTSGTFTVGITAASTLGSGFNVWVLNSGTGAITLDPNGTETIDGNSASLILNNGAGYHLLCDGSGFRIIDFKSSGGFAGFGGGADSVQIGSQALASGAYSIALGYAPSATGARAFAVGFNPTASALYSTAFGHNSGGGSSSAVTGSGAMALGGSYANGTDSFAAANADNTGTYGARAANSVSIGYHATVTGASGTAIGTNVSATASSAIAMGINSTASGTYSIALGSGAVAAQNGKVQFASAPFGSNGDAQYGLMVLRASPGSGASGVLTSDGNAAGSTNQLIAATNTMMTVTGMIVGKVTGTATGYSATFTAQLINNGGTCTLGAAVTLANVTDGITLTTAPTVTADNTNKGLSVTSGAKTATVIKWVCTVQSCEITY